MDIISSQTDTRINRQTFSRVDIKHPQGPEATSPSVIGGQLSVFTCPGISGLEGGHVHIKDNVISRGAPFLQANLEMRNNSFIQIDFCIVEETTG